MRPSTRKLALGIAAMAVVAGVAAIALRAPSTARVAAPALVTSTATAERATAVAAAAAPSRERAEEADPPREARPSAPRLAAPTGDEPAEPQGAVAEPDALPDPLAALASPDPYLRSRAAEALARQRRVDALPMLQSIAHRLGDSATPAVLKSIGRLATMTTPAARDAAAASVGRVLVSSARAFEHDATALGDTLAAIDALADAGSAAAVEPLVTALDTEGLPLSVQTKIVEALSALEAEGARAAITRFLRRAESFASSEPLDRALRDEAVAAAKEALARLALR